MSSQARANGQNAQRRATVAGRSLSVTHTPLKFSLRTDGFVDATDFVGIALETLSRPMSKPSTTQFERRALRARSHPVPVVNRDMRAS